MQVTDSASELAAERHLGVLHHHLEQDSVYSPCCIPVQRHLHFCYILTQKVRTTQRFPSVMDKLVKLDRNSLIMGHEDMHGELIERKVHVLIPGIPSVLQAGEDVVQKIPEVNSQPHESKTEFC